VKKYCIKGIVFKVVGVNNVFFTISEVYNKYVKITWVDELGKHAQNSSYNISHVDRFFNNGDWIECIKTVRKNKLKKIYTLK